eukprot:TRINITY_DN16178_c0_g1_i1.p1 TRINITY_DN16178_c0_g1~~TRINITY_DN16178_c0_g1_i1.p1  ORF type:complete len:390 (+),score=145.16 TRINITY_DN16178_c0_g1_i1:66-1235(+)
MDGAEEITERLVRHEEVLRQYREKFEEHKVWLQGQPKRQGESPVADARPAAAAAHPRAAPPVFTAPPQATPQQVRAAAAPSYPQEDDRPQQQQRAAQREPVRQPPPPDRRERSEVQPFRPAQRVTGHPLRVYDRVTQWQRRREQNLNELRQQREQQELTSCTFNPTTRTTAVHSRPKGRMPWDHDPSSTFYGHDGKAWGYHDFVERQREARRRSKEGSDGAFCTGRNWRNEITVPQEFQLGRRDRSIKSLQKPLSPPTCVPSVGEHHHLAKEIAALPKDSPLRQLQEQGGATWLPRAGLFSERISAKIIDYAMTQPGLDGGAPDPLSYGDETAPPPAPTQSGGYSSVPQGHFSSQHGHFGGQDAPEEWKRRSAEKTAIEQQLYGGRGPG